METTTDTRALPLEDAQASFEYAHADGTLYHAESLERARAACPVLGKMALEQANLLLEVAAIGQQKLKEEQASEEQEPTETDEVRSAEKPSPEKTVEDIKVEPVHLTQIEHPAKLIKTTAEAGGETAPLAASTESLPASSSSAKESLPLVREPAAAHAVMEQNTTEVAPDSTSPRAGTASTAIITREHTASPRAEGVVPTQTVEASYSPSLAAETVTEVMVADKIPLDSEPGTILILEENNDVEIPPAPESDVVEETEVLETEPSSRQSVDSEHATWTDELEKAPGEIYADFAEALQAFIALADKESPTTTDEETERGSIPDSVDDSEPREKLEVLAVVATVAERLSELTTEERETVVPLVNDIAQAHQAIGLLETKEAAPEATEAARAELHELVGILFEQLGIDYEPEDIERLIAVLPQPDFQPTQLEKEIIEEVDLEHDGTHEVKYDFTQVVSAIAEDVERDIKGLIGALALFKVARAYVANYSDELM